MQARLWRGGEEPRKPCAIGRDEPPKIRGVIGDALQQRADIRIRREFRQVALTVIF